MYYQQISGMIGALDHMIESMRQKHEGPVRACQICRGSKLEMVLSLGHQPIVQDYLTGAELLEEEATFPLHLVRCTKCGLLQLDYVVDPKKVFPPDYPYRTGLTNMLIRNFQELAATMEIMKLYKKGDLVVDVGSNDGTLLKQFKAHGARVVGVEPTNAAKVANQSGIPTVQDFIGKKAVQKVTSKFGMAQVVTATNAFAHINDTHSLVDNIKSLMGKDSVFVSESQYLMDIIEKLEFDTIYHEHLRFYALKPLVHLFKMHGMSVIDAERIHAAGGSIRVYAKKGTHPMSARAKKLLAAEKKAGLDTKVGLRKFTQKVLIAKRELLALLLECKKKGARIVGVTSSARSNTLLGFTHIDDTILDYTGEKKGSPKIGMYTPGTHIPVVDEARIFSDQPDFALILSWHIGEELAKNIRAAGYKGKFIIPLPKPRIIS